LHVAVGDEVMVTDIVANFNRGLTADFVGMGSHNDTNLPFRIAEPTEVLIRKDAEICGSIALAPTPNDMGDRAITRKEIEAKKTTSEKSGAKAEPPLSELRAVQLLVNVGGILQTVEADGEIEVWKSTLMVIKGVHSNISRLDRQILVNLKGFSPEKHRNIGNDINFPFSPERDLWQRFSEDKKGIRYPIEATYNNRVIGNFWLRVK
jgi:hypothetical protein